MANWPFWKRKPELRVAVKENSVSVQCLTDRTFSLLNALMSSRPAGRYDCRDREHRKQGSQARNYQDACVIPLKRNSGNKLLSALPAGCFNGPTGEIVMSALLAQPVAAPLHIAVSEQLDVLDLTMAEGETVRLPASRLRAACKCAHC